MDDVARNYIALAFAVEQHFPGLIDGYYGPDSLKSDEKRPLDELAAEADALAAVVSSIEQEDRRAFLRVQVRAMQSLIALSQGQPLGYKDEVRQLYDVEPVFTPEATFDAAIATINGLLSGTNPVHERMKQLQDRFIVPAEKLDGLVHEIMGVLAERTKQLFTLPGEESFEVQFVRNQPWGAYNWYLGNGRSRIDINTDLPIHLKSLPYLLAHEGYPGHHTEHSIKDQQLYRESGRGEHAILLLNAPECVVSEGIATRAIGAIMHKAERQSWITEDLAPYAGIEPTELDQLFALDEAQDQLEAVSCNAAILLHTEGASKEEIIAYIQRYSLVPPERAESMFSFIAHPSYRSYVFTYLIGGQLLDKLFAQGNQRAWFNRLLHEPATPSTIRQWISNGSAVA